MLAFAVLMSAKTYKSLLPPAMQNLSKRDIIIYSVVFGTIAGAILASIIWGMINVSYNMYCAVSSECFEILEETEEEKKRKKDVDDFFLEGGVRVLTDEA